MQPDYPSASSEMKRDGLATKLLNIMCCRDGCSRTFRNAFDCCCVDCCTECLLFRRDSNKLHKHEIEYVIQNQYPIGGSSSLGGGGGGGGGGGRGGVGAEGGDNVGYVNEACTETMERRSTLVGSGSGATATTCDDKDIKNELYQKIEMRRSSSISTTTPIIDWKSIQFWTLNTNKEPIQPKLPRRPTMEYQHHFAIHSFKPHLYELDEHNSLDDLTDDEKLEKFRLGQLHFSVQYEIPTELLLVKVIEAKDLARPVCLDDSKQDMSHSNPYVRVCLLPDQKNAHQTSVKRKTQCPVFEETFAFELSYREVQMRTLQLKVKDFDKYSRHCVLGQVLQPLANVNLVKGRHMWKPLLPCEKERPDLGDILISLNYLPSAGRLNVDVIKAKQLLQTDLVGGSVPFVRVSLVIGKKHWKSKKTSYKKNTIDPVFNESFSFNVRPSDLNEISIVLTVWDSNSGIVKDDFIGRVVLGRYATGPDELTHWDRMIRCHRSAVAQWHTLRSREEADDHSPASQVVP